MYEWAQHSMLGLTVPFLNFSCWTVGITFDCNVLKSCHCKQAEIISTTVLNSWYEVFLLIYCFSFLPDIALYGQTSAFWSCLSKAHCSRRLLVGLDAKCKLKLCCHALFRVKRLSFSVIVLSWTWYDNCRLWDVTCSFQFLWALYGLGRNNCVFDVDVFPSWHCARTHLNAPYQQTSKTSAFIMWGHACWWSGNRLDWISSTLLSFKHCKGALLLHLGFIFVK